MFETKVTGENQNTHFIVNKFAAKGPVYEIIWGNMVEPVRSQMAL
jgi:hypothetical protein